MLSIEIKVNGTLIAGINAINKTGGVISDYDFSGFHFPLTDDYRQHPETFDGEILEYARRDGILELVKLMLEEITNDE
jgi:hypothetical protein